MRSVPRRKPMTDDDILHAAKALSENHEFVTVSNVAHHLGTSDLNDVERRFERLQHEHKVSKGLATTAAGCFITYAPADE